MSLPDTAEPACITLVLETVKSGRNLNVRGVSGKAYEFRWNEQHKKLAREYRSLQDFSREELDLRKMVSSPHVITTRLGTTEPVTQAREAVTTLIGADRKLHSGARRDALVEIAAMTHAAIEQLDAPVKEEEASEEDAAPPAPATPHGQAVPLPTTRWSDPETGIPIDDQSQEEALEGALTKPVPTGGIHQHAELMQADIADLRSIAKSLNIKSGQRTRADIVTDILAAEAA